ncbi:hypothetical protein GDO81_015913 [Engystomops pustulosus]|uniref:Uncharacterized protein n=1 Tax=Engystomops pustulosus TaxID=76066 RepID=A0AAV7ASN6_ENGPU|nr:hypothetical protein GDO81_015913 [Engystomops pustulosus]
MDLTYSDLSDMDINVVFITGIGGNVYRQSNAHPIRVKLLPENRFCKGLLLAYGSYTKQEDTVRHNAQRPGDDNSWWNKLGQRSPSRHRAAHLCMLVSQCFVCLICDSCNHSFRSMSVL